MSRSDEGLPEFVFDALDPQERRRFAAALDASPALAREAAAAEELVAAWAQLRVKAETPPPALRQRLLDTVGSVDRFRPFFASMGRLFDLAEGAVREILARVDQSAGWSVFPGGARYFHFLPGPSMVALEAGVVRMAPGTTFPRHRHRGGETTLVLDGMMYDRGQVYGPGAIIEAEPGSSHDYRAGAGRDLLLVSRHGGIEFIEQSPEDSEAPEYSKNKKP
ncbi:MAG TPA: cupin domain-containing protein [Polyangia bacterium]